MSVRSSVDPEGRAVHGIVAFDKAVSNVALFADDEDVNDGMAMKAIRRDNRACGGGGAPWHLETCLPVPPYCGEYS